ncbi:DUF1715-domain-containing protein [Punctularia strigosozonata HHB-11173 SS5]|uniref:DUF1715-domain-containing protein n=1 Tax=Punctularia strigosozonata (strain HHB-11173) TaxID=741275 RepID=UPI0004416C7B|nr:DUF1715-domain-containing protein [Punctularia strigosozonata HHB-11173 SS5]EIN06848.1 DUF1715-domain-containing protein [Punctularia strigosozonata HHB-11173 SS5]
MDVDLNFDIESLVHLEQTFYDAGYKDGYDHGRIHGLIEGRALGREKGYEMWEELAFYEGFAVTWRAIVGKQDHADERTLSHISHLLNLISQFPRVNPSTSAEDESNAVDIPKLFRQIHSRYRLLCASLGVKPSLRSVDGADGADPQANSTEPQKKSVWPTTGNVGLSF